MSILEAILSIFLYFFKLVMNLVPVVSLPDSALSAVDDLFSLLATIGFFVPLVTFAQVLIIGLAVYYAEFFLGFFTWFLRKIPFLNVR